MYIYYKKLETGKVRRGTIKQVQGKLQYKPHKYKFVNVLALVDDKGVWLNLEYWKLNQLDKAHDTLLEEGWKTVKCAQCQKDIVVSYYICRRQDFIITICSECRYQDKTKTVYEHYSTI